MSAVARLVRPSGSPPGLKMLRAGFAHAKIQPPRLRAESLVARGALEARVAQALATHRVVLLGAAAGYGKTTTLVRALQALQEQHDGSRVAWVSADEGDDLHRLLEALVAALEPLDIPWRTAPEALFAMAAEPATRPRAVAELVNALDASEVGHGVIVVDDLHRIDDGACHEFLDRVVERLGARWCLALATRHDPPLSLARLRGQGELAEFRAEALCFDAAEARTLAERSGVPPERAETLRRRTHGWPAGLRLAMTGGSDGRAAPHGAAGEREVFEFLAAEVIGRLPQALRDFLLRASVLPELTASRAAAVTGDAHAARRLDEVERLGLFVTALEAAQPTLRLHDLFRDALQQRLQREHPEEWPALWRRAAAGEPDPLRRVPMLLRGGDEAGAAEVLMMHAAALLAAGAKSGVVHLLDLFPGDALQRRPALQTVLGLLAWTRRDFLAMRDAMRRAEAGHAAAGAAENARAARALQGIALNALGEAEASSRLLGPLRREPLGARTHALVLQACLWHALHLDARERVAPLLESLVRALERDGSEPLWYAASPAPELNGLPGTAPALRRYVEGALRLAGDRPLPLRALAQVQRGWQLAWQAGDLDGAEAALAAARDDSRWLGEPGDVQGAIGLLAAHLHALRGEHAAARTALEALLSTRPATQGPAALWSQLLDAARIAAVCADGPLLDALLARLDAVTPAQAARLRALRGHQARLAGDTAAAVAHWQAALEDAGALQRMGQGVDVRLHLAAALADGGRLQEAREVLAPALDDLAGDAGLGAAGMARPPLQSLLAHGLLDAEARARLSPWLAREPAPPGAAPAAAAAGGLSERELQVLACIADGESNKLIARRFDLSPHTVKRHVANILDKLGVDSRGHAAAWYRRERG